MDFKIGDIVRLKSGGPSMTVVEAAGPDIQYVSCAWFAGSRKEVGSFPPEALIPTEEF